MDENMVAVKNTAMTVTSPTDREIVFTRVFDAPGGLVFKSYIDPKLIPHWWGPRSLTTTVDSMQVRPGRAGRFVQRGADGNEYAFSGIYRGIVAPDWLAYTFEFELMPGHVMLETLTFEEFDGKTKVIATARFDSTKVRDGMLNSGMEKGAAESWDRFAEILQTAAESLPSA
jgi:uncharacterized protein YndB with AHSA1/START domain